MARARLKDSEILLNARRYDGAAYMCGYAIELKLKTRICRTLNWASFPSTRSEFQDFTSFKTHDLDVLLELSGIGQRIQSNYATQWREFRDWEPEMRYNLVGTVTEAKARQMIAAARTLLRTI
jgi:hypothetical protein